MGGKLSGLRRRRDFRENWNGRDWGGAGRLENRNGRHGARTLLRREILFYICGITLRKIQSGELILRNGFLGSGSRASGLGRVVVFDNACVLSLISDQFLEARKSWSSERLGGGSSGPRTDGGVVYFGGSFSVVATVVVSPEFGQVSVIVWEASE